MTYVTKEMTFGELLMAYYDKVPAIVEVLMNAGMGCIGCPHSQMEAIADGAMGHGVDPDALVEQLNATISAALGE